MKTRQRIPAFFLLLGLTLLCSTGWAGVAPPPVSDPNGPYTGTVGELVLFNGSGSTSDFFDIVQWDWDFGDGNTGSGETTSHAYSTAGLFNVTLTVYDNRYGPDTVLNAFTLIPEDINNDSASTTADISPVPVPAAVWLFGSGLIGLIGIARKRKTA